MDETSFTVRRGLVQGDELRYRLVQAAREKILDGYSTNHVQQAVHHLYDSLRKD